NTDCDLVSLFKQIYDFWAYFRWLKRVVIFMKSTLFLTILIALTGFFLLIPGCKNFFRGSPELGSRALPISFYIDSSFLKDQEKNSQSVSALSKCLETKTGFRVKFSYSNQSKSVTQALALNEAQFGLLKSTAYVAISDKVPIQNLMILTERNSPLNRSVILGLTAKWRPLIAKRELKSQGKKNDAIESALEALNNGTIAYTDSQSISSFLVPKTYLLFKNLSPGNILFVGNESLILKSLEKGTALAGGISEAYLQNKFFPHSPSTVLTAGKIIGKFIVLGVSQPFPEKLIVGRKDLAKHITAAIELGLHSCSRSHRADFYRVLFGNGVSKTNTSLLDFIYKVVHFQENQNPTLGSNSSTN
ncbi:MAG: phosphate/phosphite/phosphonate ABC transporter substrate-binding protein, partial [Silvanigrellaceae bacterium]|nr:phosphate/phosphite/phosphonate ABC transporter substrate-binding protein [Silvanigrellaceae bacterium]